MSENRLNAGDVIRFGNYPQGHHGLTMPIEWCVLDVREDRALLLSRYILDFRPFAGENGDLFWGDCELRNWLENEFRIRAFSAEESARIVRPERSYEDSDRMLWQLFRMEDVTENIPDTVFTLSYPDILHYFPGPNNLFYPGASAPGTEWVREQADSESLCWWLRTASAQNGSVNIVSPFNSVGACMDARGSCHGVRPALWLRTD